MQSCALDSCGLPLVNKVLNVILVGNTWNLFIASDYWLLRGVSAP